jgi:hypothetical protein
VTPLRWFHGRMYGHPDLPRRTTWLALFTFWVLLMNALIGRVT